MRKLNSFQPNDRYQWRIVLFGLASLAIGAAEAQVLGGESISPGKDPTFTLPLGVEYLEARPCEVATRIVRIEVPNVDKLDLGYASVVSGVEVRYTSRAGNSGARNWRWLDTAKGLLEYELFATSQRRRALGECISADVGAVGIELTGHYRTGAHPGIDNKLTHTRLTRNDLQVIRIVLDADARTRGAIRPRDLAQWSQEQRIFRIVFVNKEATVADFTKERMTQMQPQTKVAVTSINSISANTSFGTDSAPQALAVPLGTSPILSAQDAAKRQSSVVTYRQSWAEDSENLARVLAAVPASIRQDTQQGSVTLLLSDQTTLAVAPKRVIQLELNSAQIATLRANFPTLHIVPISGFGSPLRLDYSRSGARSKPLDDATRTYLKDVLSRVPKSTRRPLLLIADDSWPSVQAFQFARDFLKTNVKGLWGSISVLAAKAATPAFEKLEQVEDPGLPDGSGCTNWDDCSTHAMLIAEALEPYISVAASVNVGQPVDVLYVPLNKSQKGAEEFLRILFNLAYAYNLDSLTPLRANYSDQQMLAQKNRDESVFLDSLDDRLDLQDNGFSTNRAIMTGIFVLARLYSIKAAVPVFINLSWTTTDIDYDAPSPSHWVGSHVFPVAAAGNHCPDDNCSEYVGNVAPKRLFSYRAANSRDYLVVMNLDASGQPTCKSSRLRLRAFAVGFDGALSGDCGTSFASPRVAWLLATKEAFAPSIPVEDETWHTHLADWIAPVTRASNCKNAEFKCAQVTVQSLLAPVDQRFRRKSKGR